MRPQTTRCEATTVPHTPTLFLSIELSGKSWLMASRDGQAETVRHKTIGVADLPALLREVRDAKSKFGLPPDARVLSCYEAGRDGFWLHRFLLENGIENLVLDASSLQVDRRMRRAKTDRLDASSLVAALIRFHRGETEACRPVFVPSPEAEDARRGSRERDRMKHEENGHRCRIAALLALVGVVLDSLAEHAAFTKMRTPDGNALPPNLVLELEREQTRLRLVCEQRRELEKSQRLAIKAAVRGQSQQDGEQRPANPLVLKVVSLMDLVGIGQRSAWKLAHEFFFKEFANRRQVGSAAGMVNAPYASGGEERDQGITKAGNRRVRGLMIELAWAWLRLQPESALTLWFHRRFGQGKRTRKVGIVALGRRLLIALWRYLEQGVVPDGARLKSSPA